MECKQIQENLSDYLDGELQPDFRNEIRTHLDQCNPCREYRESLIRIAVKPFKNLQPVQPPDRVWSKIQERIDELQPSPSRAGFDLKAWLERLPKPALGFAGLLGMMILVSVLFIRPQPMSPAQLYLGERLLFLGGINGEEFDAIEDESVGSSLEIFLSS